MGVELSPQELDLLADRSWRLSHLYKILNKSGEEVVFKPNWAQQICYDNLWHKTLVLKIRQPGVTTGLCMLWLDLAMFTPNIKIGIVAHTQGDVSVIIREKILFAYKRLPEALQLANPIITQNAEELIFANGAKISAGVTFRSGTIQILHVTEFGHICKHFPARAKEVLTGSMQAVPKDGIIVIESTAKGREGGFYTLCQDAQTPSSEWAFTFLPWFREPSYFLDVNNPIEYKGETEYLDNLQFKLGIVLTPGQRQWWCSKRRTLGEDVYSEYPSTPEEAFRATIEGSYYSPLILQARQAGRITRVPIDPALLVHTWWDLGMDDATAIWFVQFNGYEIRVVDYYEDSGEGLPHYAAYLQKWALTNKILYGTHAGPHDIKVRELGSGISRLKTAENLGIRFVVANKLPIVDGIERVRATLPRCVFDEARCEKGLKGLEHYRKEWDSTLETYRTQPRHDWASHSADSFRTGVIAMDSGIGALTPRVGLRQVNVTRWT